MKYDAIIDLPHWDPRFHLRMPHENRAAQFSPFDPLDGYEESVVETARETDTERYLDEESISTINLILSDDSRIPLDRILSLAEESP